MKVPFFDWPGLYDERSEEFQSIFVDTLSKGAFILQQEVYDFEEKLADYVGAKYAVGLSDGTNAILLGLRASCIEPGDEVLITSHSFIAAAQSIIHAGGIPIPVELSETDWLMSVDVLEEYITAKTKAIMPVHVNGRMCKMDQVLEIANKHHLKVFEDAAQAMGAKFDGTAAGNFGEWGTFSFYPSKTLGCFGDAGALVTNSHDIYEKVRSMRNHGATVEKQISLDLDHWGTNCRLDNIQAAILKYKLTYYDDVISRRREIAQAYNDCLYKYDDVFLPPSPKADIRYFDIYQNYEFCTVRRNELRKYLSDHNIGTIIQWGGFGLHQLENLVPGYSLPITDKFFDTSLLLPLTI